jgi:hypothetical protein
MCAKINRTILTIVLSMALFELVSIQHFAATQTPKVAWKEFSPKGGGFTVQWPTRFPTDEMDESPNGPDHTFAIDAPLGVGSIRRGFLVTYTDLPNIPDSADLTFRKEFLNRFAKGFIEAEGKPTDTQHDVMLGAHPGKELRMSPKGTENIVRAYLVGRRFYMLTALVPTPAARTNAQRFLDSFKLLTR